MKHAIEELGFVTIELVTEKLRHNSQGEEDVFQSYITERFNRLLGLQLHRAIAMGANNEKVNYNADDFCETVFLTVAPVAASWLGARFVGHVLHNVMNMGIGRQVRVHA
jgi:hypothetical protein